MALNKFHRLWRISQYHVSLMYNNQILRKIIIGIERVTKSNICPISFLRHPAKRRKKRNPLLTMRPVYTKADASKII